MKKQITRLNELRTLIRQIIKENVETLKITRSISDEGNTQINLTLRGGTNREDSEIMLSLAEAKELHQLAEQFLGQRRTFSKAVNTKDKHSTQSLIQIEAKGLKCIISRQEGSVYKGYDEPAGSSTGYFVANQSIAYQLVDKLLNNLNELEDPNAPDKNIPADVKNLRKAQQQATGVQGRAKAINTPQEFPEAFKDWFESLGYEPGKISKSIVRSQVEKVLTSLGYK
jgi:hypothetical protein